MIETQFAHSDPPVYSVRRDPILVCPHCKRAVDDPVSLKSANTVFGGAHGRATTPVVEEGIA